MTKRWIQHRDSASAWPDLCSPSVEVETLRNNKEIFFAFEECGSRGRDLLIRRVPDVKWSGEIWRASERMTHSDIAAKLKSSRFFMKLVTLTKS